MFKFLDFLEAHNGPLPMMIAAILAVVVGWLAKKCDEATKRTHRTSAWIATVVWGFATGAAVGALLYMVITRFW